MASLASLASVFLLIGASAQGQSLERLFLNELEDRLTRDTFFRSVPVHVVDEGGPVALLTQNPPNQRNKSFYVAWMRKLHDNVLQDSLRPQGLVRQSTHAVTPVIVLANETWLRKYWRTRSESDHDFALSTYDEELGAVVTCESSTAAWLRRQPMLRDLALGLLDAYAPSGAAPSDLWFRRGFAKYVSTHTGTRVSALDTLRPKRSSVEFLFQVLRRSERREALWIPLGRLMATRSLEQLSGAPRGTDPSERDVFDQIAALWLHFFHNAQEGKYREGAGRFLVHSLAGTGAGPGLEECFGTRDVDVLEREFESYIFELFNELFVKRIPGKRVEKVEEEAPPPVDLSALVQEPEGLEEVLALALWRARSGNVDLAITGMEGRVAEFAEAERSRLERELFRLRTLQSARDAFLNAAIASRKRVRLQFEGGKRNAKLVAVEDGELRFADEDEPPIAITTLDSVSLALSLGSVDEDQGGGWIRSYGLALGGDDRWKRFLRDRGDVGSQLEADAKSELAQLASRGRGIGALNELGNAKVPETPGEARSALEHVAWLLEELSGERKEQLDAHRGEVGAFARRALELRFLDDGISAAIRGNAEPLEDGRLRVSYDFSDAAHLEDFEKVDPYLKWRVERLRRDMPKTGFKVERERLRGSGFQCLRHRLQFAAPMSVAYEFEFEKRKSSPTDLAEVLVAICDDGEESYLGLYGQGELHVDHQALESFDPIGRGEEPTSFQLGLTHEMEIRHDGERASTWRFGEMRQETPALGLTSGHVFLWVAVTGKLRIDNIVIEGTPLPESLRELRDTWVGQELEKLGLGEAH